MFYNTNLPPHLRVLKDEIEGYARDYGLDFFETVFEVVDADDLNEIAAYGGFPTRYPHWSEVAAMWAVLTRLSPPKHASLSLLQKLKLYNGKTLPGFTEDNVIELKRDAVNEGMVGISPRYIQDKISNALVAHPTEDNINPFMVMKELEDGLRNHSLIK